MTFVGQDFLKKKIFLSDSKQCETSYITLQSEKVDVVYNCKFTPSRFPANDTVAIYVMCSFSLAEWKVYLMWDVRVGCINTQTRPDGIGRLIRYVV